MNSLREFGRLLRRFDTDALFVKPTENAFVQFFRFIFVGGLAALVDLAVATLCYETFGLKAAQLTLWGFDAGALLANGAGFLLGLVVNYILSILWIFKSNMNRVKEFTSFALIGLVGLGVKLAAVALLERFVFNLHAALFGVIPMVSVVNLIATFVAFLWNFTARKYFLYTERHREDN